METINLKFPSIDEKLDQDAEYFILENHNEKILFHDYERIFEIPGLYEEVFQKRLSCHSPEVISEMLFKNVEEQGESIASLRILDFGAGNGLVAENLSKRLPKLIVGVDLLKEAKAAALRDRKGIYSEYLVTDLSDPRNEALEKLKKYRFNTLITVAALGFGHIVPQSFINAFNLVENGGWIAFNLSDQFLTEENDESGFKETLSWLETHYLNVLDSKTYLHRYSMSGEKIFYKGFVGRKIKDIES